MIKENCYWYEYDNDMGARIPYCKIHGDDVLESCDNCEQYHSKYETTNADRFRAMSDEELAVACEDGCPPGAPICNSVETIEGETVKEHCQRCWLSWLKSPVEEEIE